MAQAGGSQARLYGKDYKADKKADMNNEAETMDNPWRGRNNGGVPDYNHFHTHNWLELIDALEGIR